MTPERAGRDPGGQRRRARQPAAQARPRVGAHAVPVRRALRLRRVPRPPAPPPAHDRVAAPHAGASATTCRPRSTRPACAADWDRSRWSARARPTTRSPPAGLPDVGAVRGLDGLPDPVRDADDRARGDAPDRAAVPARRAPRLPGGRPGDAPRDRRGAPGDRRRVHPHLLRRRRPGAPRGRAPNRAQAPSRADRADAVVAQRRQADGRHPDRRHRDRRCHGRRERRHRRAAPRRDSVVLRRFDREAVRRGMRAAR